MSDHRPLNCRFRLQDEGMPYPRSYCSACGRTIATGLGTSCREVTSIPDVVEPVYTTQFPGLTKREYAAIHIAAALAGRGVAFSGEDVAKRAVELADAVLKEAGE